MVTFAISLVTLIVGVATPIIWWVAWQLWTAYLPCWVRSCSVWLGPIVIGALITDNTGTLPVELEQVVYWSRLRPLCVVSLVTVLVPVLLRNGPLSRCLAHMLRIRLDIAFSVLDRFRRLVTSLVSLTGVVDISYICRLVLTRFLVSVMALG